jgi:YVTN family beta-propeller protein
MNNEYKRWLYILTIFGMCSCASKRLSKTNLKPEDYKEAFLDDAFSVGPQNNGSYVVSTSQVIDPAGKTVVFPGRAVDLALNPKETILAVKNMRDIIFFNIQNQSIMQTLQFPKAGSTFKGIDWSSNTEIWVTDDKGFLRSAKIDKSGLFRWNDSIFLPGPDKKGSYPGGIAINKEKGIIYVTLNRNNTIGVVNMQKGKLENQIPVGIAPYSIVIKQNKAYVTNWGGRRPNTTDLTGPSSGSFVVISKNGVASSGTVSVIDLVTKRVTKEIEVHLHPCGMSLSPDSSLLYVANANSDLISVIDTKFDKVVKTISAKPMKELPFGSGPNSLTVSPDAKTLYIADGSINLLAVIDLKTDRLKGLIPTGWYPSAVCISKNSKNLFVVNMKGVGSRWTDGDNLDAIHQKGNGWEVGSSKAGYNTRRDQTGSVSFIQVPDMDSLEDYTVKAAADMRMPKIIQSLDLKKVKEKIVPVPTRPGEKSVFKHVIYIIKENRTYDQILGDMPQGNGDSTLCMFGRYITPNHHKLSSDFVLLDNLYCNSILSATGHNWTSQGYVTDYLEKAYPGFVRSYPWNGNDALVYASTGFIWDYVLNAGLSFHDYGEFVEGSVSPENSTWTDIYNDYKAGTNKVEIKGVPTVRTLEGHICPTFIDLRVVNDQYRADLFIKDLHASEKADTLPSLIMMSLSNDHTSGTQEGFPTPRAMVADNDLALGRIVEAVSKSKFWKNTVFFVVEDDPQFGLDHVDAHRTVAFCISPYTKRGEVISTHYNMNSILRTIELILGLPPMSQLDLVAMPMENCFTDKPDFSPYTPLKNNIPLNEMNPALSSISGKQLYWAKKSMNLELNDNDDLDLEEEDVLNKILWHSVKGFNVPYPEKIKK